MTEVVLRNDKLPQQPIVITVGPDGVVPAEYAAGGWWIDHDTSPIDARAEAPRLAEAKPVTPRFADDPVEVADEVASTDTEAPAAVEAPAEPDTTDEPGDGLTSEGN